MISRGSIALFGEIKYVIERYFFNKKKVKYLRKIDDDVFVGFKFWKFNYCQNQNRFKKK